MTTPYTAPTVDALLARIRAERPAERIVNADTMPTTWFVSRDGLHVDELVGVIDVDPYAPHLVYLGCCACAAELDNVHGGGYCAECRYLVEEGRREPIDEKLYERR